MMEGINETVNFLQSRGIFKPTIGIVLGTGLGNLIKEIEIIKEFDYEEIPNFPLSTVEFHKGKLIYARLGAKEIIVMQGRFHYYEGYSFQQLTFPIRVMKLLGVKSLLLSNACGSMNPDFKKGSLMVIDDHINLLPGNPLIGKNYDEMGPRFPDMSMPYSTEINQLLFKIAGENDIELHKGVYVAVSGPNLETRAEYRFLRMIGADVVGMSTIPEVIVANQIGLRCSAVSVITDECDPDNLDVADINSILSVAAKAEIKLIKLMKLIIDQL